MSGRSRGEGKAGKEDVKRWEKAFSRSSTNGKHTDKHGASENFGFQRSYSISKGGSGYGPKEQSSGSHDGDFPAHVTPVTPITVTSIATRTSKTQPKVKFPERTKRGDSPSGKDINFVLHSWSSDPQGRRDSKNEVEYYKEQYRKLKSENENLRGTVDDLGEKVKDGENEVEYYKEQYRKLKSDNENLRETVDDLGEKVEDGEARARRHNQTIAEFNELVSKKDYELSELQKAQEVTMNQLVAFQKICTLLNQEKDKIKTDFITLEQSYKTKIADLQVELSAYNKKLLEAQEDDISLVLQEQLEKALDPLENIEELKEVVDLEEEIGRGSYGRVKKVSLHGTICAAKDIHAILINYASDGELERIKKSFLEECVKCSKLFHPNIVQFLGIHYPNRQAKLPWLVMELLDCNLSGFIKKYNKERVSVFVKASIFYDVSLGLQFLHNRDIIHRDLSSNNVLLTKHLTAKITDLGVAKLVDPDGTKSHTVVPGTQHFLPPEVISNSAKSHYGKPIDVFSCGCIMIHLVTHEWPAPLPETHYDPKLKKKVVLSEIERRETYLNQIQNLPELKVLIKRCLHDDPFVRPNVTKIVDELGKLKILYQKNSSYADSTVNAVEFEKHLKLQDERISELQLALKKLTKQPEKK